MRITRICIHDCRVCSVELAVTIPDEQMQKQRRKCHLPSPELAGKSEKQRAGFGAGVIFGSAP